MRSVHIPVLVCVVVSAGLAVCASGQTIGTFSATGNMGEEVEGQQANLLQSGMVLVTGGEGLPGSSNPNPSAELYNPTSGSFAATGSENLGRFNNTATTLSNGMVLVAGGLACIGGPYCNEQLGPTNTAELYNPSSGEFTYTGSMTYLRIGQTATTLPNGNVLMAGGTSGGDYGDLEAEIYNLSTGEFTVTGSMNTYRAYGTSLRIPLRGRNRYAELDQPNEWYLLAVN